MRKIHKLFKIFIPAMLGSTLIAATAAALALCLTYQPDIGNIRMRSPLAIFFVITTLLATVVPVVFITMFNDLKINRTKRDIPSVRFASIFAFIALAFYEVADSIYVIQNGFEAWRFLRVFVSLLFLALLVFTVLPSKISIPPIVRHIFDAAAPIFSVVSILSIYFWGGADPLPEYFEILFIMTHALFALFFLFDFKWKVVKTSARAYTALSSMAFVFGAIVSVASLIGVFVRDDLFTKQQLSICLFEIILILGLSVYSLSKTLAVKATVDHIIKTSIEHSEK